MKRILFFILLVCISNNYAQVFDIAYSSGNNYKNAEFRFRIPQSNDKLKALLVLVPGYNWDGRDAINDSVWQAFAHKHNLAMAACFFKDYEKTDKYYREASKGSGQALLDAIYQVAMDTKKLELENIPLVLWGMSAGGQFNYEFACWKPEKVLTFVVNKGGFYHTAMAPKATQKTPAIFFIGEDDLYYRKDIIKGIYSMNRRLGAHWTLITEKNTAHDCAVSRQMAIKYFETIIPLRLSQSNELVDLSEIQYYLGDWGTKTVKPFEGKTNNNVLTIWLPNAIFASEWESHYK